MGKLLSKLSNRRCHSWAKKLSYRWETCATLYISWNVVQITQTDRVSAWGALSATVTFYSATCRVLYTQHRSTGHSYRTATVQCSACHQQTSIQPTGPYLWSTTSTITNVVYDTASVPSSTRTTVADGHKFSAVRRLSQRLLDQSKNAIFTYRTCIWLPSWGWSHRNFIEIFCIIKLESLDYHVALFLRSYV